MLSLAKQDQYYQFFLSQGVGMGLGFGLLFIPTLSVLATHFREKRALATGIATSGNSFGGVILPICKSDPLSSFDHNELKIGFRAQVSLSPSSSGLPNRHTFPVSYLPKSLSTKPCDQRRTLYWVL